MSAHRLDAGNRCEDDEGQKGTAHHSSVSIDFKITQMSMPANGSYCVAAGRLFVSV